MQRENEHARILRPPAETSAMAKLALVPLLLAMACLLAGFYGVVHNQISYTVCPEYFTQFKFHQFRIENVPDRLGAAIVGWKAAWWMGLVIGAVLIPAGLVLRGTGNYFWGMIRVFVIVALTTLFVGLGALAIAFAAVDRSTVGELTRYGNEISDDVAFARAGTMHNFSYLGGLIGIVTGGIAIYRQRRRQQQADSPTAVEQGTSPPAGRSAAEDLDGRNMQQAKLKRGTQFQILDILLLVAGLCFTLGILVPAGGPRPSDQVTMIGVVAAMVLAGSAISYSLCRFCLTTRLTVCLVNHAGYLLIALVFIVFVNHRLLAELPVLVAGPLSLFGRIGRPPHLVSRFWDQLFITGFLTTCMVLLMSAHTFRRNWIGVLLTSLGVALWYLAGTYGVLARGP